MEFLIKTQKMKWQLLVPGVKGTALVLHLLKQTKEHKLVFIAS
jgi:hypothetical protein